MHFIGLSTVNYPTLWYFFCVCVCVCVCDMCCTCVCTALDKDGSAMDTMPRCSEDVDMDNHIAEVSYSSK